ncbi:SAM-dependent methyltransferase [Micromonospora sp. DR5-3]|uniref:TRM11 family SAM-dependent methyltransferase n=1 Tax=unclassified Micromonospora TaxID=2617518 RepID=UPI0011D5105F|nr:MULTISPECIES: SAM-dependent methyltransferase [unclassified Micromonospora]MCW3813444.1 SAM-dependent methyltransferase [Micromonospora sp. DR5-3]TYC24949.1 SAM-dependent methyltransferase [Micromonospora sp. MP36]
MTRYALLLAPSANRVYADAAGRLARAELEIFAGSGVLDAVPVDAAVERIGGVEYLTFAAPGPGLGGRDLAHLANLSAAYALFERVGDDLLRPVPLEPLARYDSDLITIPKYAGKTNEQFTRLLLNVTVLASASAGGMLDRQLVVLDPLCGRGTTLNQALMYGYDGIGVEHDGKDVDAYGAFLRTWLRRKRLKHTAETVPVRRDRKLIARRFEAVLAPSRDEHRAGATQRVTVLHSDTTRAREVLRPRCADVIVTDAPYGVAHGSRTEQGLSRSPLDLLGAAVPVWRELLRPGGALGLSWNTQVAPRAAAEAVLAGAGLRVVDGPGWRDLAHRVDQAIDRDVLVAVAPTTPPARRV